MLGIHSKPDRIWQEPTVCSGPYTHQSTYVLEVLRGRQNKLIQATQNYFRNFLIVHAKSTKLGHILTESTLKYILIIVLNGCCPI